MKAPIKSMWPSSPAIAIARIRLLSKEFDYRVKESLSRGSYDSEAARIRNELDAVSKELEICLT